MIKNLKAMKNQKIEGIIRHILSFAAGSLVLFGYITQDAANEAQSIVMMVSGAVFQAIAWYRSYITKDEPTPPDALESR